jgi:hypothetical protein
MQKSSFWHRMLYYEAMPSTIYPSLKNLIIKTGS